MKQLSLVGIIAVLGLFVSQSVAAQGLCSTIDVIFSQYETAKSIYFGNDGDLDDDGFRDKLSLRLVEAVACVGPETDLKNASATAYAFNLDVFDAEPDVADLLAYRRVIAAMMLIGTDIQAPLNAAFGDVLVGTYAVVQCSGADCTPDPVAPSQIDVFSFVTRATNEPYTGTGDLDLDGTNNVTELNNVEAKHGFTSDFIIAATSPALNGTEVLRNPGANGGGGGGGCFIATAAYGTPMAGEVNVLRDYRDATLLTNPLGSAFVDSYYRVSPVIADVIAARPVLKSAVRVVLEPVIWMVEMPWVLGGMLIVMLASGIRTVRKNSFSFRD